MSLLYKYPRIGNLHVYDTASIVNKSNMMIDFNRIQNNKQLSWTMNPKLQLAMDHSTTNFHPLNFNPILNISELVLSQHIKKVNYKDRLSVTYQRRKKLPFSDYLIPQDIKIKPDFYAIMCVNLYNTDTNLYTIKNNDNRILKELSQGYMFVFTNDKELNITPSENLPVNLNEETIEDTLILSYYINNE